MKFDSYTIIARLFPGIISAIPFFVLHFFFLKPQLGEFWKELLGIKIASDVTISFVFLFVLVQLSRLISKEFFEKRMFANGLRLPTTDYLLHLNSYFSPEFTNKIHQKISNDFNINIPSLKEEANNEIDSRKRITEAISLVRAKVGKGTLVNQHNTEYGFMRNLAGGSIIALVMSVVNIIIFICVHPNQTAFVISCIMVAIYSLLIIFGKWFINIFGHNYARILIQEYMSK